MPPVTALRAQAVELLRELTDLAVCQASERGDAAKRTQRERDELAERFVNVMVTVAEAASAKR